MVLCNNYQSIRLRFVQMSVHERSYCTPSCFAFYCCVVTPKLQKIHRCTAVNAKLLWIHPNGSVCFDPGGWRFQLFQYFCTSGKTKEIQGKQKEESIVSEEQTGEEISVIALGSNKTWTEAEYSKPQQNSWIKK